MKPAAQQLYDAALLKLLKWNTRGALALIEDALTIEPDDQTLLTGKGICLLQCGRWLEGWEIGDRIRHSRFYGFTSIFPHKRWRGEKVKRLALLSEEGIGDEIMLSRYIPWVLERAETATWYCHTGIPRLFVGYPGLEPVLNSKKAGADAEAWCYVGSLPALHGTTRET